MYAFVTAKIGTVLAVAAVLAVSMLLAAGSVQAHTSTQSLPNPSCSSVPTSETFFTADETTNVVSAAAGFAAADEDTKQGGGVTGRGDLKYRYAKITVPALAAGELRVFDTTTTLSDAVLCPGRGGSPIASSITSYSAHNSAQTAAKAADTASNKAYKIIVDNDANANTDNDDTTDDAAPDISTVSKATTILSNVRSGLSSARSALGAAVKALNAAAVANPDSADVTAIEVYADTVADYEQDALTLHTNKSDVNYENTHTNTIRGTVPADPKSLTDVQGALTNALSALTQARTDLQAARNYLSEHLATGVTDSAAQRAHTGFQIRAAVSPGDEEYVVVVAPEDASAELDLDIRFHGVIDRTASTTSTAGTQKIEASLKANTVDEYTLTVTAPGLLTVETTGSTDTIGTLDKIGGDDPGEVAQADPGDSGGNFKIIVPVIAGSYTLEVEGQTSRTTGAYALEMDFKVAMTTQDTSIVDDQNAEIASVDGIPGPTWTTTALVADDTTVQIRKVADKKNADEDYFVFKVDTPGLLTLNAKDDGVGKTKDADTKGTLFGAMGEGTMGEKRVGQIATDTDSGPGKHFGFTVPVEANRYYLAKVEGTEGAYLLEFDFTEVVDTDTTDANKGQDPITPPAAPISGSLTARGAHLYLFSIEESGTLYLHTTGETDVYGTLYGPDGKNLAEDNDSGDDRNFRIAKKVAPGLYILEVKGNKTTTAGAYTLVSSFVTGPGPTEPTDPDPDPDPPPAATDEEGELEDPPNNGTRSGIGLIRGWVCQATSVQVRITGQSDGASGPITISPVPYGSDRGDVTVADRCENRTDTRVGFAVQFNYNLLEEGTYTATASADGQTIETNTFEVVRISDEPYLTGASSGQITVRDFPFTGDTTVLEWDEASQNFQIVDH